MHLDGLQGGFSRTPGSADPPVPPLATSFVWETDQWVLLTGSRCRGLDGRFGLSGGPLLLVLCRMRSSVVLSAYSSCFLLIPDLCSWKHKFSNTTMELGLGYKYVSKRRGFPSLVSIVDGHILHLMTVNSTHKRVYLYICITNLAP